MKGCAPLPQEQLNEYTIRTERFIAFLVLSHHAKMRLLYSFQLDTCGL